MPVLSIVIPLFNASAYIYELLSSIDWQVQSDVEILLLNDGSTDNTEQLVQQFLHCSLRADCYRYISQSNQGVSAARNQGIRMAKGQYIGFADADDVLRYDYFEKVLRVIKNHKPDLIEFGYQSFKSSLELEQGRERYIHKRWGLFQSNKILRKVFKKGKWYPCIRVYNKKTIGEIRFPVGVCFCEDLMTIPAIYARSKKIFHLRESIYGYRDNELGATNNPRKAYLDDLIIFFIKLTNREVYKELNSVLRNLLAFKVLDIINQLQCGKTKKIELPEEMKRNIYEVLLGVLFIPEVSVRKKVRAFFWF